MKTTDELIENKIIQAVKKLLTGTVNQILDKAEFVIPILECEEYSSSFEITPIIELFNCERQEKERILMLDTYALTISFELNETQDSQLHCYAYSGALGKAIYDDPTLGGVVDRVSIAGKKYITPKKPNCGGKWGLIVSLRISVEGINK